MITKGLKCGCCGADLKVDEVMPEEMFDDELGERTFLVCENCGVRYDVSEPSSENKKNFEFYSIGGEDIGGRVDSDVMNEHCLNCGHRIYVTGNFMLSDLWDDVKEEDDMMSFNMSQCPYCGCEEVRWEKQ